MNVGVVGAGVVGRRLVDWFSSRGDEVVVWDPLAGHVDDLSGVSLGFVAVPTPISAFGKMLDCAAVFESARRLSGAGVIVVRSTVEPGVTKALARIHPGATLIYLPEFLTERTAESDFLHPCQPYVVGITSPAHERRAREVVSMLPLAPFPPIIVGAESAELVKLASNAFYAVKVSFANQVADLAKALDVPYEEVRAGLAVLPMVGPRHLDVGQDGYRGFGGKCLPKDALALVGCGQDAGAYPTIVAEAIGYNRKLRST